MKIKAVLNKKCPDENKAGGREETGERLLILG